MEEEHQYSEISEEPQTQKQDGEDQQLKHQFQLPGAEEKLVLQFMDSMHNYLSLFDTVSSTLRQGWFDLASARQSTGASRINSSLLHLKSHSAATTLKITNCDGTQPRFMLRKWISAEKGNTHELEDENLQPQNSNNVKSSGITVEVIMAKNLSGLADNAEFQKVQSKSLSVFGVLISPKLRASQLSFEKEGGRYQRMKKYHTNSFWLLEYITCGQSDYSIGNPALDDFGIQFIDVSEDSEHFPPYAYILILLMVDYIHMNIQRGETGDGFLPNAYKQFWAYIFECNPSLPYLWPKCKGFGLRFGWMSN